MVYLDYSATTPVNDEVLDSYVKVTKRFIGNPNSLHKLGSDALNLINDATEQIKNILDAPNYDVIYTSGASESNNLAIKGIALKYQNRGKHIITTNFEHSSIYGPLSYLQSLGFEVDIVNNDENGMIDINHLKKIIRDDTILVTVASVNSEIGLLQPVNEIGKILKDYPKCYFHVDMTQSIGKIDLKFDNIDLISCSSHKFYGMKGFGILFKRENILLEPLIHGGKSTTVYRSGTPALPLIASTSKALRLAYNDLSQKYNHVKSLNDYLKKELCKYDKVVINSNDNCIPHILNVSILNIKPETMLHALEEYEIYISTKSACSSNSSRSRAVYSLTHNEEVSEHSIRISLSYLTAMDDIKYFMDCFDKCYNNLQLR